MHYIRLFLCGSFLFVFNIAINGQVTGRWKTLGMKDGKEKSIVEIYEQDGKLFGKIVELLPAATYTTCANCSDELKNKPLKGLVIIKNLFPTIDGGENGVVLDPTNGKTYGCYVQLVSDDKLKLRGYVGTPALGKTQYWYRVN